MNESDKTRFFTMAETYDKMAPTLVPQYDFLQDETLKIPNFNRNGKLTIADTGAGSGIMLEKVLTYFPNAKGYWVDYSDDFRAVAEKRLSQFGSRINFITSSFKDNWEEKIPEKLDLCTSMSAIHHLESNDKQELYERIFKKLNKGGWFFNIDEMKTFSETAYKNSLQFWVDYVNHTKMDDANREYYDKWLEHFKRWEERNITEYDKPKQEGDDLHEPFTDQLQWLENAGFKNSDIFIKYHLWCVIGGMKP